MSTAYKEACEQIDALAVFPKKNSLDHTRECLRRLGSPEKAFRCVHVAGTNGKGSVCAFLTSVFEKAGKRCGLFISPHLVSMTERIQVDGCEISEWVFSQSFDKVKKMTESLEADGIDTPSYFEFLFLMAMTTFAASGVDIAVLETGLGGRLDATNSILNPYLSVITNIALDHTKFLGNTIPEVASEKAGIIKRGIPVVFDARNREAEQVIRQKAEEELSVCTGVYEEDFRILQIDKNRLELVTRDLGERVLEIPFPAPYEAVNAAVAVKALMMLRKTYPAEFEDITDTVIETGLRKVKWEGRMEKVAEGIYFDGAHNPDGMKAFLEATSAMEGENPVSILFGAASDKAYPEMIRELTSHLNVTRATVTEIESPRAVKADELARLFKEAGVPEVEAVSNPADAFKEARSKMEETDLFCIGSLYLIGSLKAYLKYRRR